ncbi:amp dependent CoA ligase [Rhodotorula diobovata]|uniref:Amp dependent CoA ligase n=1 Tax=Rhodotorula diobovata TaxID=5288 RepID=A0A5C5G3M2_9BASI|nr:amp dependent CoA ligase [Rhodotorula diobovata]
MPFDAKTGIYTRDLPRVQLPQRPLSIYDFLFDPDNSAASAVGGPGVHTKRADPTGRLWLIDAASSRQYTYEDARARTDDLARAFYAKGLKEGDTLLVFSPNDIDYGPAVWATFRNGGVASCANPAYMPAELAHQIDTVHKHHPVKLMLVHPDAIETAVKACENAKFSTEMIVLIRPPLAESPANTKSLAAGFPTLDDLVASTREQPLPPRFSLKPDEARTRLAFLSFSSGTTGVPKAVMIPHAAVIANVLQDALHWERTTPFVPYDAKAKKGDVIMGALPFYHIYGLVVILHHSLYQNTPVVVHAKFEPRAFLQSIQDHRITTLYLVPPQVIFMVKQDELVRQFDLSSVRMVMAGAAPLTDETIALFRKRFPHISVGQGYGMTESSTIISTMDASPDFPGSSAGLLLPNVEAKIVSPEGKALPPNEVGELWSRGPSNALGYLNNDKATAETFDKEGFLHTGDEAFLTESGMLTITDRIKELIKCSGFQVAPAELEGHLLAHEDVQDVCVIGVPDDRKGEVPKAYVVMSPPAASRVKAGGSKAEADLVASIKKFVADHKIKYKHLAEVEFIEAIPKTPSGKLLRRDLRTLHAQKGKKNKEKL